MFVFSGKKPTVLSTRTTLHYKTVGHTDRTPYCRFAHRITDVSCIFGPIIKLFTWLQERRVIVYNRVLGRDKLTSLVSLNFRLLPENLKFWDTWDFPEPGVLLFVLSLVPKNGSSEVFSLSLLRLSNP